MDASIAAAASDAKCWLQALCEVALMVLQRPLVMIGLAAALASGACSQASPPAHPGGDSADATGGGGGEGGGSQDVCDLDRDGHRTPSCGGDDCNDRNPGVHPGAEEL